MKSLQKAGIKLITLSVFGFFAGVVIANADPGKVSAPFVLSAVTSNYNGTGVSCNGSTDGNIDLTVTGGSAPFNYLWNNGQTVEDITGLNAGTYTVTVQDNDGTIDSLEVIISEPSLLSISSDLITNVTCNGNSDGAISITASGGTSPFTFLWNDASTDEDRTNLAAGTFTVTVTDANSCTLTSSFEITEPNALNITTDLITNVTCNGNSDGAISITASGGTSPFSYLWNDASTNEDRTVLTSGTYTVTVTDANSCTLTSTFEITEPNALNITTDLITNVICNGNSDGAISITASGGTSPFSYLWNDASTNEDRTVLTSGTYTVTVTDANSCTLTSTFEITEPNALNIATDLITNITCNGNTDGAISITASGGTLPYSYLWNDASTNEDRTNIAAGTYTVTVTDANSCTLTSTFEITQPNALNITTDLITNITCNGNTDGAISITASGGNVPFSYLWNDASNDEDRTALTSGTYTVTVTDANTCTLTSTFEITQPNAINIATDLITNITCNGNTDGAISITASGGNSPFSYLWNDSSTDEDRTNLAAGTFTVTVTDANSCTLTSTFEITQPNALNITTDLITNITCNGNTDGAISITTSGGNSPFSYLWNDASTDEDRTNLAAGTFTVTVTDANSCTLTSTFEVTEPNSINIATDLISNVNCNGNSNGAISITASGGNTPFNYLWNDASTDEDRTALTSGTYTVTVTDANSCTLTSTFEITQPNALNITTDLITNITCNGNTDGAISITTSGGNSPFSYLWNDASTDEDRTNLAAGTFTVTVTDANSCTLTSTFEITEPNSINIATDLISNVNCNGNSNGAISITASGGNTPFNYLWNDASTDEDRTNLAAGTYTVTVTDANSCTLTSSVSITQPDSILITSSSTAASCGQSNGSIDLSASGGTGILDYLWSTGATTSDLNAIPAGNYTVTVTDANNCSESKAVVVNNLTGPAVSIDTVINLLCNGNTNGAINISVSGGALPYNYLWSNGFTTEDISGLIAATYTVTVTDFSGCQIITSATVTQPAVINIVLNAIGESCGQSNGVLNSVLSGGTGAFQYLWNTGATNSSLSNLVAGTYTLTVTDQNACTQTASANVLSISGPIVTIQNVTDVTCFNLNNGTININITAGTIPYSFLWSNGSATQNQNGLSLGTYTVTVSDFNNCTATLSQSITQPDSIAISETVNPASCGQTNGSISILATGGTGNFSYLWSTGNTTSGLSNISSGNYTITVTDSNNCSKSKTINVSNLSGPAVTIASFSNVLCYNDSSGSININVAGGAAPYSYLWSNGVATQNLISIPDGLYTVTVTDSTGCEGNATKLITEPGAINVNVSSVDPACGFSNGAATVAAVGGTGALAYLWSNGSTSFSISSLSAGTYTVTVSDANVCTKTASVNLSNVSGPSVSVSNFGDVSCFGGNNGFVNLTVSGGNSPYQYLWSNGATTKNLIGLTANIYQVTVTDQSNCTTTSSVTITQPLQIIMSITTQPATCNQSNGQSSVSVSGGTAPFTYLWNTGSVNDTIKNLAAGVYTVTITDNKGCTSSTTASVVNQGAPNVSLASFANVLCHDDSTGSISINVSGGVIPYLFQWSNGKTTQNISTLTSGTYTVIVTDNNTCTATLSKQITQPPLININFNATNAKCNLNNGNITAFASGGIGGFLFLWSNGSTLSSINNLSAGTYTITVTDQNNCLAVDSYNIIQAGSPVVTTQSVVNNICFGASNGSVSLIVSGGTTPYNYQWSNGETTKNISALTANTYSVTVTDNLGCTVTLSASVTQPNAITISANSVNATCGQANGSVTASATGGTGTLTFLWTGGATTNTVNNLPQGVYTLTVTDQNNCTKTASVAVNSVNGPIINVQNVNHVKCFGQTNGSISVNVLSGQQPYIYNWSNGATSQNINNLAAGTYTLTVTDANNCPAGIVVTVNQPQLLSLTLNSSNASCGNNNGNIAVVAQGGTGTINYFWSNGSTNSAINNLSQGNYTVVAIDQNGCTATGSASIINLLSPTVSLDTIVNVTCFNGSDGSISINASGGTNPLSYNWSNGTSTQNVSSLTAGIYTVIVTDSNSCTASLSAQITQPSELSLAFNNISASCGLSNGSVSAIISGGVTPFVFVWSNGASGSTISNVVAGTYTITVSDNNLCVISDSIVVNDIGGPVVTLDTLGNENCFDSADGFVLISVSGGTPQFSFNWSDGSTVEDLISVVAGTYTVTVTDANNCSSTSGFIVTEPIEIIILDSIAQPVCGASNGEINLTVSGGAGTFNYLWSTGETTSVVSNLSAGTFTVTVTDIAGCTSSKIINLSSSNGPAVSFVSVSNVICHNTSTASIDVDVTGGTPPYSFNWSNGSSSEDLINIPSGFYNLLVIDSAGCSGTVDTIITQPPKVTISLSKTNSTCGLPNGSVKVVAAGGVGTYSYLWSNGGTNDTIQNVLAGTYIVIVTDQNGCTKTGSIGVSTTVVPVINLVNQNDVACFGGSGGLINIAVNNGQPFQYSWSNGATTQDIFGLVIGTYTVSVTNQFGCSTTGSYSLTQPDSLSLSVSSITATCSGPNGSAQVSVSGGVPLYSYLWNNGTTSAFNSGVIPGTYTVTVTDDNSCSRSRTVAISDLPSPQVLPFFIKNINCFNGSDGIIDIIVSGAAPPFDYLWSNNATTQDISVLPPGSYTVTVTDTNNCVTVFDTIMTQPDPLQIVFESTDPSCGNTNGKIKATITGGTPPYTYFWSTGATVDSIFNLSPGNYSLYITDQNSCTDFNNKNLINTGGAIIIDSVIDVKCFGQNTGAVYLDVTSFYAPLAFLWSNGSTSEDIINVAAGTYTISVTDSLGCITTNSYNVLQPPVLIDSISSVNPLCGQGNGTASVLVTGGVAPYTYLWSNGFTSDSISNLAAGTYTILITEKNGCTLTDSVILIDPGAPVLSIASKLDIKCYNQSTGLIDVNVSQGQGTISYLWSTGATTKSIVNLVAGTYTVTATDQYGCFDTLIITLIQPTPVLVSFIKADPSCALSNGSLTVNASGGVSPYSYVWSNGLTTQTITGLSSGTYTVIVYDDNNCLVSDSAILINSGIPLITIDTIINVLCDGGVNGSVSVTVSSGLFPYTYLWSNGVTTSFVNSLSAGVYTVTVSDDTGCTSTLSISVTQPPLLQLNLNSVFTTCNSFNGSAYVVASGGVAPYGFQWSNGATIDSIINLGAATYTITVSDNNNCTKSATVTIGNLDGPQVSGSVIDSITCFGLSDGGINISLNGSASPFTFLWSNGSTDEDAVALSAGIYSVIITDTNNCVTVYFDSVPQPDLLSLSFTSTLASCGISNGSAASIVAGGTLPYTYLWTGGSGNFEITNVFAGVYTLTITDVNNCSKTDSVIISNPQAPIITNPVIIDVACFSDSTGSISIDVAGPSIPFSYLWSNSSTSEDLLTVPSGTYTITVTDSAFCTATAVYSILQPGDIYATVAVIDAICNDSTGVASVSNVTGGTGPYSFLWSNGSTSAAIVNLTAGIYTLTVTDNSGCSKDTNIVINNISGPTVVVDSITDVLCSGGANGEIFITVSGNNPPLTILWSNGSTNDDLSNLTAATYIVTVTDVNNCKVILPVIVNEPQQLNYAYTLSSNNPPYNISCAGAQDGSIDLSVLGGVIPYTYLWNLGSTDEDISNIGQGNYTVLITDNNGCTISGSFALSEPPVIIANAGTNQIVCGVDSLQLNATQPTLGNGTWSVSSGAGTFADPSLYNTTVYNLDSGANVLNWIVSFGNCNDTSSIIVNVTTQLTANAGIDRQVCEEEITLSATQPQFGFGYWQLITGTGSISDTLSATTLVTNINVGTNQFEWIVNNGGCSDSDMVTIVRLDSITCLQPVEMATGFTPNGDGKNDFFIIKNIEDYGVNTLTIYNRWGNVVYEMQRYMNDWAGTGKDGKPLPDGTYFYTLSIKGVENTIKGFIDLRR